MVLPVLLSPYTCLILIVSVSDRLGWLTYTHGALASTLANKVQEARAPFKVLRAADHGLAPRRAIRANIENQISKLEHDIRRIVNRKPPS